MTSAIFLEPPWFAWFIDNFVRSSSRVEKFVRDCRQLALQLLNFYSKQKLKRSHKSVEHDLPKYHTQYYLTIIFHSILNWIKSLSKVIISFEHDLHNYLVYLAVSAWRHEQVGIVKLMYLVSYAYWYIWFSYWYIWFDIMRAATALLFLLWLLIQV